MDTSKAGIFKNALIGAGISGVINAVINGITFFKHDSVPITLDHISNQEVTVFGKGVMTALMLSLILTSINYLMFAKQFRQANAGAPFRHPFWPWGATLAIRHSLTAFGAAMVIAVLWQRFVGVLIVSPLAATAMMFGIAFLLVLYVNMGTMSAMLHAQKDA